MTLEAKVTFRKQLRSFRAAFQSLGILRNSWRVFHDQSLSLRYFQGFVLPVSKTDLRCDAWLPIHSLIRLLDRVDNGTSLLAGAVFEYKIRSEVSMCIHFVVYCLCVLCQWGLYVVPWSLIVIFMHLHDAEPPSTA